MIPISRVEMYLAKICGEDVELPIPQTRKEVFLAIIAGESYAKPVPSSRVELYLAKILGDDVPLPIPQSREEIFLAKIAGVEYPLPYPESRIEYWLHKWATYEEWETISGNPVSFTAKAAPLRQLEVAFSPVQDLHGYYSPWPAGGGKNLLQTTGTSQTRAQVEYTVNADGTVKVNGTANDIDPFTVGYLDLKGGTSYTLSSGATNSNSFYLQVIGAGISGINTASGAVTFTPPSDITGTVRIVVTNGTNVNNVTIKPMVCLSTATDPTVFAPYSNLCPILGWDSLTVEQRGKNLNPWDGVNFSADTHPTGLWLNSGDYVFSLDTGGVFGSGNNIYIKLEDRSGNLITSGNLSGSGWSLNSTGNYYYGGGNEVTRAISFHLNTDCFFYFGFNNTKPTANGVQLEVGSTATAYEPYNPSSRSITISLGSTIYSGILDVVTGVVTVDMAMVDLGSFNWNTGNRNNEDTGRVFYVTGLPVGSTNSLCSIYKQGTQSWEDMHANNYYLSATGTFMVCADYANKTDFATAVTGQTLCYELATPLTIQLTPQEVESLAGDNVLFSDANGALTVEYRSN